MDKGRNFVGQSVLSQIVDVIPSSLIQADRLKASGKQLLQTIAIPLLPGEPASPGER